MCTKNRHENVKKYNMFIYIYIWYGMVTRSWKQKPTWKMFSKMCNEKLSQKCYKNMLKNITGLRSKKSDVVTKTDIQICHRNRHELFGKYVQNACIIVICILRFWLLRFLTSDNIEFTFAIVFIAFLKKCYTIHDILATQQSVPSGNFTLKMMPLRRINEHN